VVAVAVVDTVAGSAAAATWAVASAAAI
jgi:hypothetical protein